MAYGGPADPDEDGDEGAVEAPEQEGQETRALKISDDTMLRYVREERRHSIGFGEQDGGDLLAERERALLYYKGDVTKDIPDVDKRSKAVSTDVAEAIDTAVPDLAEIFLSGEDIITFAPDDENDEQAARDETDFIAKILFQSNNGFVNFTTAFKDALLLRTGIFHWWWEETEGTRQVMDLPAEQAELAPAIQAQLGQEAPEQADQLQVENREDGSVAMSMSELKGKVCYKAIAPEDFTAAQDTIDLEDTVYCCMRERGRIQAFIERGFDADQVRELPEYARPDQTMDRARDESGETDRGVSGAGDDLRIVEIRSHYLRVDRDGDGETELWCVYTDSEETVLLGIEEADHVPFSSLTPYMSAHRFYGESVADRLLEIQRIKTTLLRMMLDSGYFALNQRMSVDMTKANEFTIPDLLRNEPNMPVRTNGEAAVQPLAAGQLGFDVFGAMEYASTMAEQRTGIVRNAQGLNPDTLHDTATGAMQLISAAQKRLRFIARVFAETGIKKLCLGIHRTLRCNWTDQHAPMKGKFGRSWKTAQPHQWPEREDMEVHVGPVSKEHELAMLNQQMEMAQQVIQLQGGTSGPFITADNLHNLFTAWSRAAGQKSPELYWSDPSSDEMQQAMVNKPQAPNPDMAKVQGQLQIAQQEMQMRAQQSQQQAQADMQLRQAQAQSDAQLEQTRAQADADAAERKAQREMELAVMKHNSEMQLAHAKVAGELQLKREQLAAELQMKRELGELQIHSQHQQGMAKAEAQAQNEVHIGGKPG